MASPVSSVVRPLASLLGECRKIIAIGRNYAEHAKELGNEAPSSPVFFLKPPSSFITQGQKVVIPQRSSDVHHEVELGVVIGKGGKRIAEAEAMSHIGGYILALDMTARDIQSVAKGKGLPWSESKGYDTFTPVSDLIQVDAISNPHDVRLWLKVNGEERQNGSTDQMIFSVPSLISHLSTIMTLQQGDLILTGTPAGVSQVHSGDLITAGLVSDGNTLATLAFPVVKEEI
eukprot:CAMPEP_0177646426 /NCGR_PEP_ID=MMETSP0447-20121125/9768_1 /TAXON_ID=0 /ORGANISM="Stygamoeba regulata, Strain BSH-02190019" /LENGTH=230 /DNA_ID=CAMNT_0019148959 /DNA_START=185 /DNA_END=877 /DNA_ORIENTATION=-